MRTLLASAALLAIVAIPAKADRPVTDAERAKLILAVAAQGCTGGKMEWDDDDRGFEVEDAVCNDGRKYELKFDAEYLFNSKKADD
jgi:Peptidase propeptide and YPEB domain